MAELSASEFHVREVASDAAATMERIGRLRAEVWADEGSLAPAWRDHPGGYVWLDEFDPGGRHWVVETRGGELVACARLTVHPRAEGSPDGPIWLDAGRPLAGPVGNIAKLVVRRDARGRGLAGTLNRVRIDAARGMGARSLTVTASKANARLLAALGFVDTGLVVRFANRPGVPFHALELQL